MGQLHTTESNNAINLIIIKRLLPESSNTNKTKRKILTSHTSQIQIQGNHLYMQHATFKQTRCVLLKTGH